jgi:hypothetical protein
MHYEERNQDKIEFDSIEGQNARRSYMGRCEVLIQFPSFIPEDETHLEQGTIDRAQELIGPEEVLIQDGMQGPKPWKV